MMFAILRITCVVHTVWYDLIAISVFLLSAKVPSLCEGVYQLTPFQDTPTSVLNSTDCWSDNIQHMLMLNSNLDDAKLVSVGFEPLVSFSCASQ